MIAFDIVELEETDSTNRVAAELGRTWQVFTAEHQTAGRGRIGHRWLAPAGVNLAMSVVLPVVDLPLEAVVTLPLIVGHSVLTALYSFVDAESFPCRRLALKWPNDILIDGCKVCGILCERHGDNVIAGIGINVLPREFPAEISMTATYLAKCCEAITVREVRDAVLEKLGQDFERVKSGGFAAIYPELREVDYLRGRELAVLQTDDDVEPIRGICGGIAPDGSLDVGGHPVYAGEAHVQQLSAPTL